MKIKLVSSRPLAGLALTTVAALVASMALAPFAGAVGSGTDQSSVVSTVPSTTTPDISDGTVYAITQVGNRVIVGGSFSSVANHGSTTTVPRSDALAFDVATGVVSTTFAPTLDGTVRALAPGPTSDTVYLGGGFTTVNGVRSKGITLLNTQTGAIVSGFKPPALNGVVFSVATTGSRLYVAGTFTTANGIAHGGIASLNPTTGTLDAFMNIQFAGHHNYNGSTGANGAVGPRAMAANPAANRLMVVGNFKTADGLPRDQAVMIDLDRTAAAVDPNWATLQYTAACFSGAFDTYMTDVQYNASGSYFVIAATGGSGTNIDGTNSLCDTAARWTSSDTGSNVKPGWVDYTGQDSLWSVAITGTAVYVGGHQRWLNNSNGFDYAGAGAVPRPGIAALDPDSGVPLAWNPGRNPRGAGAYALYASSAGLYVGSDTDYIGNFQYKRKKIAFFPLAGGYAPASTATARLPSNLYEAGPLSNSNNSNVLYRVNAGGPTIGAADNGPDWMADASDSDPGAQYRNTGSNAASWSCCATPTPTVPSTTPTAIFDAERWDPGSKNDGNEMHWAFPVAARTNVAVRMYFANRYSGTSQPGQRVFDVAVDGTIVLNRYDIAADVGDQKATMKQFNVTSPGNITIDFTHEVENPLVDGIELINLDKQATTDLSTDSLAYRPISGSTIGPLTTVPNTGVAWGSTRGAFMVGNTIFYGAIDGNFYRASFDGTTVGGPTIVDPYDDPYWSSVNTGSGQTYRGVKPTYYSQISSITGDFYWNGRLYYAKTGQAALSWRWFSPDSGIIGSQEFTVGGADFSNIAGMVLSSTTLYYANRSDGTLHAIPFTNGVPDGSQNTVISGPSIDGNDWRARGMFLYGSPTFPNQLPTARATSSCIGLTCSFDGTASSDPDGSIVSYGWDFGDGAHGTGPTPSHGYAQAGTYNVSLVVTDNRGGQSAPWTGQVSVQAGAATVGYVAQAGFNGSTASPSVTVPRTVSAGATELLFVTVNAAGLTTTVPAGWQQIAQRTNSTLETTVFQRVASSSDAGSTMTVPLAAAAKVDLQLVAYSGVSPGVPVLATAADSSTASHTTPAVSVAAGGSWVVSYWSDRTSNDTIWTLPASVVARGTGYGTGGGRVDSAIADSGSPLPTGQYGGLTASSGATSGRGDMVSVVLAPAAG